MAGPRGFQTLVGALVLVGLSDPVAGQDAPRPGIVVTVFNDAGLAAETLSRAEAHVARIYNDMGVDLLWADSARTDVAGRFVAHIIIRRTPPRPRMLGNALGDARGAGGTAFVYSDRVREVAQGRGLDITLVLAYAMAHEMGHLLLPAPSHAVAGIMHANWDGADFQNMATDALRFTRAQANAIRARASRLRAETRVQDRARLRGSRGGRRLQCGESPA